MAADVPCGDEASGSGISVLRRQRDRQSTYWFLVMLPCKLVIELSEPQFPQPENGLADTVAPRAVLKVRCVVPVRDSDTRLRALAR